jgi:hypothetical protein
MKIEKMRLSPEAVKKGKESIKKRSTKELVLIIILSSTLALSEGAIIASNNVRVIKRNNKKPVIKVLNDNEIKETSNPGEPLTQYELKKIANNNTLKRILKK